MGRKYTDNALTTLAAGITSGSTTLAVAGGDGDKYPAVVGHGTPGFTPDFFVITMENSAGAIEKMRVEQRASGVDVLGSAGFPLIRGYDGTTAQAWIAGDSVDLRMERVGAQDVEDKAQAAHIAFGVKGSSTAGLVFGFYGGVILNDGVVSVVADNSVALTASQTNFIERTVAGVVSANTAGFSADKIPMYEAVTDGSGITTITDRRSGILYRGRLSKSVAGGSDVTLTAAEARAEIIELTGLLTASIDVVFPAIKRTWIIQNSTTGTFFTITAKVTGQPGVVVDRGATLVLYCDGTDIKAVGGAAAWTTGDVKLTMKTAADSGWIMANDGTIGSAASGAGFANASAEALFTLLWNNVTDAFAPVSTGRGANAAADWAANKTITLTRMLGRALGISGAGTGLTARALGEFFNNPLRGGTVAGTWTRAGGVVTVTSTDHGLAAGMAVNANPSSSFTVGLFAVTAAPTKDTFEYASGTGGGSVAGTWTKQEPTYAEGPDASGFVNAMIKL